MEATKGYKQERNRRHIPPPPPPPQIIHSGDRLEKSNLHHCSKSVTAYSQCVFKAHENLNEAIEMPDQKDVQHEEEEKITKVIKEQGQYIIEVEENEEKDDTIQKGKNFSDGEEETDCEYCRKRDKVGALRVYQATHIPNKLASRNIQKIYMQKLHRNL